MMLTLPCRTPEEFGRNLSRFVETEATLLRRKITYLDCGNTVARNILENEYPALREKLRIHRIDRAYDLLKYLALHAAGSRDGRGSHFLLVSPFYHLLEGFPRAAEKEWMRLWEKTVERAEQKHPLHVVIVGD